MDTRAAMNSVLLEIDREESKLAESLKFFCMNFGKSIEENSVRLSKFCSFVVDPLANGLRRRAQSLNIAIRTNQPISDSSANVDASAAPGSKRRRRELVPNRLATESRSKSFRFDQSTRCRFSFPFRTNRCFDTRENIRCSNEKTLVAQFRHSSSNESNPKAETHG